MFFANKGFTYKSFLSEQVVGSTYLAPESTMILINNLFTSIVSHTFHGFTNATCERNRGVISGVRMIHSKFEYGKR